MNGCQREGIEVSLIGVTSAPDFQENALFGRTSIYLIVIPLFPSLGLNGFFVTGGARKSKFESHTLLGVHSLGDLSTLYNGHYYSNLVVALSHVSAVSVQKKKGLLMFDSYYYYH